MPQRPDVDSLLDAATISHEAQDLDRAESLYQDVLRTQPNHAEALSLRGCDGCGRAANTIGRIFPTPLIPADISLDSCYRHHGQAHLSRQVLIEVVGSNPVIT
jgi:hypothetical protein